MIVGSSQSPLLSGTGRSETGVCTSSSDFFNLSWQQSPYFSATPQPQRGCLLTVSSGRESLQPPSPASHHQTTPPTTHELKYADVCAFLAHSLTATRHTVTVLIKSLLVNMKAQQRLYFSANSEEPEPRPPSCALSTEAPSRAS